MILENLSSRPGLVFQFSLIRSILFDLFMMSPAMIMKSYGGLQELWVRLDCSGMLLHTGRFIGCFDLAFCTLISGSYLIMKGGWWLWFSIRSLGGILCLL